LPAVIDFLQELLAAGPEWAGVALSTAYSLFESRPAARALLLQLLLDTAVGPDGSSRQMATGLLVSKVMRWDSHAATVQEFATQHLLMLLQPLPAATSEHEQQQEQQQQQQATGDAQQQAGVAEAGEQPASSSQQEAGEAEGADAAQQQQQQQQQFMDVGAAVQHSMLYTSLCTLKPELLRLLLETYGKAGPDARKALSGLATNLAVPLGPDNSHLLELIRQPPEQSTDLLLEMVIALCVNQSPPKELVQACAAHFAATGSVQLMDPVVGSLRKQDVVQLLPKLLMQLPESRLKSLYKRLAVSEEEGTKAMFAPEELLVLLHKVTSDASLFKSHKQQLLSAVDRAMRSPEVFPAKIMTQVSCCRSRQRRVYLPVSPDRLPNPFIAVRLLLLLPISLPATTCFVRLLGAVHVVWRSTLLSHGPLLGLCLSELCTQRSCLTPLHVPLFVPLHPPKQAISRMEAMNPPPRLFMRSVNIMVTGAAAPLMKWVINLLERLIQKQVGRKDVIVCVRVPL
jgi:hypothetical protein